MNLVVAGTSAAFVAVTTEVAATVGTGGNHQIAVAVITAISTLLAVVIGPLVTNWLRTRRHSGELAELRREIHRLRARLDDESDYRDG